MMITHTLHTRPTILTTTTHTMTTHLMTTPHTTTAITATTTIATMTTPHITTPAMITPVTTTPVTTIQAPPTPPTLYVRMMTPKEIRTEILALLGTIVILRVAEIMTQTHSNPLSYAVLVVAVFTPLTPPTPMMNIFTLLMKHALLLMLNLLSCRLYLMTLSYIMIQTIPIAYLMLYTKMMETLH